MITIVHPNNNRMDERELDNDSINEIEPKAIMYVRAPRGLPGITEGSKIKVKGSFTSDARCPLGQGLKCMELENGYKVVSTNVGMAWFA